MKLLCQFAGWVVPREASISSVVPPWGTLNIPGGKKELNLSLDVYQLDVTEKKRSLWERVKAAREEPNLHPLSRCLTITMKE